MWQKKRKFQQQHQLISCESERGERGRRGRDDAKREWRGTVGRPRASERDERFANGEREREKNRRTKVRNKFYVRLPDLSLFLRFSGL
ncbi:hypothetical protein MRB53_035926 [Persea americana]|uniref:Uncharacterized protein n=1 Tax=Persea americana TaxID=3435 RepID=A0ACC2K601_PERAE|nr:hypothetical protein MRB53_035926 [Persea americana]